MMHRDLRVALWACFVAAGVSSGCQNFDGAPTITLDGNVQSKMTVEPKLPLVLRFSEPVDPRTLRVELLRIEHDDLDGENYLPDESEYDGGHPDLDRFAAMTVTRWDGKNPYDEEAAAGAIWEASGDATTLTLTPAHSLSYGTSYLFVIEPGLADAHGHATVPRKRIPFGYPLLGGGPNSLPSGYYAFLMNIEFAATQLRDYAYLDVDPDTGEWRGVFTDARRLPELNERPGCPVCDAATPICQLLDPSQPACVLPSVKSTALSQIFDRLPKPDAPGYMFRGAGFLRDESDGSIAFGTPAFDINITVGLPPLPIVTEETVINGVWHRQTYDGAERWVAQGNASVANVVINGFRSANPTPTQGDVAAMSLTPEEVAAVEAFGTKIPTLDAQ